MANSKRKCGHCGNYFEPWGADKKITTFCSVEHALAYSRGRDERKRQRQIEADKRQYRKRTSELKKTMLDTDRKYWMNKAREAFNGFIRDRDSGLPCVSCGRGEAEVNQSEGWKHGGAWDCGHFLSVGSHPELRFEPLNAHRQCKSCNGGAGNYTRKNHQVAEAYRAELVKRIGLEKVEWLEGPHEPKKYTVDELQAITAEYRIKRRELQKSHYEDIEYA